MKAKALPIAPPADVLAQMHDGCFGCEMHGVVPVGDVGPRVVPRLQKPVKQKLDVALTLDMVGMVR